MSREIKFRVLCERSNTMFFIGLGHTYKDLSDTKIMQFTGLLDKNGAEIYEGDIIRHDEANMNMQVVFENGCFNWADENGKSYNALHVGVGSWTVIGNIYENPELLEAQQ